MDVSMENPVMEEVNLEGCDICAENHDTMECPNLMVDSLLEEDDPTALNLSRYVHMKYYKLDTDLLI